ncbi:hypothetical protein BS17DRAFT_765685 [Gyrodon lividus]|nr:hypothetical protein BS17DRAFT_765685 [Gyrodon lividus]
MATLQDQLTTMATEMQRVKDEKGMKEMKFNKKFELVADPGQYEGERTKFNEWWTKMQDLQDEIPEFFRPQTEVDWARATLQNMKQGNSRVGNYITKLLLLVTLSGISDEHGIYLLEHNSKPEIIADVCYKTKEAEHPRCGPYNKRNWGSAWFNNAKQSSASSGNKTYGGHGEPMNVDAAQKGKCFNCGGPHMSKGKGRDVHATGTEQEATPSASNPVSGIDYEAMKAYFYNVHVNELKAQGKGQGR